MTLDLTPTALVVLALAVYRLTRLVTTDALTDPLRGRLGRRPKLVSFLECPWCVSVWLAAAVVVEVEERWWWTFAAPAALVLALSAVTGYLAERS